MVDTAKAAFTVDNYKEYLSLQCDSALRNIVISYPYDVSPNVDTTGDDIADAGSFRGSSEIVAARKMIVDGAIAEWADRISPFRVCKTTKKNGKYVSEHLDKPPKLDIE